MMKKTTLVMMVLFGVVACGDDEPSGPGQPSEDTGVNEPDVGTDARPEPDVTPDVPIPRFATLNMMPARTVYAVGTRVLPEVTVLDVAGVPIAEALVDITYSPGDAARNIEGRWELLKEGNVTFTACALEPGPDGLAVCASDTLVVDNAPPVVVIESPVPGFQSAEPSASVQVRGTVTDTHGEPVVYVNGAVVGVVDGQFETDVDLRFGINHIEVTATDQINPTAAVTGVDVLWAPQYLPVLEDRPGVALDDAIVFWLGQGFVDDRSPIRRAPDGTYETQDLVDILELVLRNIDLNQQISNPVINSAGAFLTVENIDIGKPRIVGDIIEGGVEIYLQLNDLAVSTQGGLDVNGQVLNLAGDIEATMSAVIRLDVVKASPTSPVEVTVGRLELAVESATANFASPEANAIFALAQSALRTTLETLLLDTVQGAFVDQLPALLGDTLGALDTALQNQTLDLDLGFGSPLTLLLDARITRLETHRRSRLEAGLSGSAALNSPRRQTGSLGIPSPWVAADPFFASSRIQIGVQQGFVNGLLHGLWDAGLLELDVTEQLPINTDRATISAKIQPLLRPPLEGQDGTVVLQVGQLELQIDVLGRQDRYGINLEAAARFELVGNALSVTFSPVPRLETWVISSGESGPLLSTEGLEQLLLGRVYPQLLNALSGGLSLNLPVPDLSGLGSVAAPLSAFTVEFGLARPVVMRDGWLIVDATLDGAL